jgi:hypothetical protein
MGPRGCSGLLGYDDRIGQHVVLVYGLNRLV